jgi:hypothetical protein
MEFLTIAPLLFANLVEERQLEKSMQASDNELSS